MGKRNPNAGDNGCTIGMSECKNNVNKDVILGPSCHSEWSEA